MRVVTFCHSLLSDWNHGNAHFLRGVATELVARGHAVRAFEPAGAWSLQNLLADAGEAAVEDARRAYPALDVARYDPAALDVDAAVDGADLVLVHEWNDREVVRRIGDHRRRSRRPYLLLFHDTHHRAVTAPEEMAAYDLSGYDGVLAFGEALREVYVARGWARRAFTWHEAADVRVFRPLEAPPEGDLVFVGNWGDEERTRELAEFLLEPVKALRLRARVHGVRYPPAGLAALAEAGAAYARYLPNHRVPEVFARHRVTVHVPRGPYARALRGIPTIRPFEALACGIPLASAPWDDAEGLFTPGEDFLVARTGDEMRAHLRAVLEDPALAASLRARGLATIRARHTCAHRVDQLLSIHARLAGEAMAHAPDAGRQG